MNRRWLPKFSVKWRRGYRSITLTVVIGLVISAIAFLMLRHLEESQSRGVFEQAALDRISAIQREIGRALTLVQSTTAFYNSSVFVAREEFRTFVSPSLKQVPGIQAIEWVPRVRDSERATYEEEARPHLPRFEFTEQDSQGNLIRAGRRPEYFPVYYVEPHEGNKAALGFDLASDAVRFQAIERARDSGQMAATSRITLALETEDQIAFLILQPV